MIVNLHITGNQSNADLQQYSSDTLQVLKLYDTNLLFTGKLRFPNLTRLEYINIYSDQDSIHRVFFIAWNSTAEIYSMISALPPSLTELVLRVNCTGQFINECIGNSPTHSPTHSLTHSLLLVIISEHLPLLETLIINLEVYETENEDVTINHNISAATMTRLLSGCPRLEQIELISEPNTIDPNAFLILRDFTCLRRIKLLYDDLLLDSSLIKSVLSKSVTFEEIIFTDYSYEVEEWASMESKVEKIAQEFPAVLIELVPV